MRLLCLFVFVLCLFASPQTAEAQTNPACYSEVPCVEKGETIPGHLVPAFETALCENHKAAADDAGAAGGRAAERLATAVADGKTIRRERDTCIGESGAFSFMLEGVKSDAAASLKRATEAERDLEQRWDASTVFLFGVVAGAVGLGGLVLFVALR